MLFFLLFIGLFNVSVYQGYERKSQPYFNYIVHTTIKPIFLIPGYLISALRFVMISDRNGLQTNFSSSVMPSCASSRTALAMVAQCSAISKKKNESDNRGQAIRIHDYETLSMVTLSLFGKILSHIKTSLSSYFNLL